MTNFVAYRPLEWKRKCANCFHVSVAWCCSSDVMRPWKFHCLTSSGFTKWAVCVVCQFPSYRSRGNLLKLYCTVFLSVHNWLVCIIWNIWFFKMLSSLEDTLPSDALMITASFTVEKSWLKRSCSVRGMVWAQDWEPWIPPNSGIDTDSLCGLWKLFSFSASVSSTCRSGE